MFRLTLATLGLLLLIPLGRQVSWSLHDVTYKTLTVGTELPNRARLADRTGGCALAFVCTSTCAYCAKLADEWGSAKRGAGVQPYWLVLGDEPEAAEFARTHNLPAARVVAYRMPVRKWSLAEERWDIVGTPTRLVVDSSGIVRLVDLLHDVPTHTELLEVCNR